MTTKDCAEAVKTAIAGANRYDTSVPINRELLAIAAQFAIATQLGRIADAMEAKR